MARADAYVFAAVPVALASLPLFLCSALELVGLQRSSRGQSDPCRRELERRVRRRLHLAWPFVDAEGRRNGAVAVADLAVEEAHGWLRGLRLDDVVAAAARHAGGWGALLAAREGLLDTSRPGARRSGGRGRACGRRKASVGEALLLWDIQHGSRPMWSGVLPLALFLQSTGKGNSQGRRAVATCLYPQSCNFPGETHSWRHCSDEGGRRRQFQISGSTDDDCPWTSRVSVLAPGCAETAVSCITLWPRHFQASGGSGLHPSLPEPAELVQATELDHRKVAGVYRFNFSSFKEEVDDWGHLCEWILHLWVDCRSERFHADLAMAMEDAAWLPLLAHGNVSPQLREAPHRRVRAASGAASRRVLARTAAF